jgi:hypothetical protein
MMSLRESMSRMYDLQAAYNTLFEEFSKVQKLNKKTLKNWKRLNLRKINWMIHMLCNTSKFSNALLIIKLYIWRMN